MTEQSDEQNDPWSDDLLGFQDWANRLTTMVGSFEQPRVISIEAGFGEGKSFFAKAWAKQLRANGQHVIEIDAWQTENSSDPVLSFVGALISAVPNDEEKSDGRKKKAFAIGQKVLLASTKIGLGVISKNASEVIDDFLEGGDGKLEGLEETISEVAKGTTGELSKGLQSMITRHLIAEKIKQDMPNQIAALREAITGDKDGKIIVIVDELDRCEPNHALKFLEAMKHVFNHPGYIFCLSVNSIYLELLAKNRFSELPEGETYIDKFVDMRFRLPQSNKYRKNATARLTMELPEYIPYRQNETFKLEAAAELAGNLAVECKFSMRQIKRVLITVETAIRMHLDTPIDCPLLILLAFQEAVEHLPVKKEKQPMYFVKYLKRADLTLNALLTDAKTIESYKRSLKLFAAQEVGDKIRNHYGELIMSDSKLAKSEAYTRTEITKLIDISKSYIPDHVAMLTLVHEMTVEQS